MLYFLFLGLLTLPKDVQKDVTNKKISMSHARVLSKMEDADKILELVDRIKSEGLSVRDIEDISKNSDIKKKKAIKRTENVSSRCRIYENILRDKTGNKVSIKSGKIVIPFDSDKDLDRIMEILNVEVDD